VRPRPAAERQVEQHKARGFLGVRRPGPAEVEDLADEAEEPMITCPNCDEPIRDPAGYQALLACLAKTHEAEDTPFQRQFLNDSTPSLSVLDEES
jgi:hypothetical protein